MFEIPKIISTDASGSPNTAEYPSVLAVDANHWLIADGTGRLFVIKVKVEQNKLVGVPFSYHEITDATLRKGSSNALVPFRLHQAHLEPSRSQVELIISTKVVKEVHSDSSTSGSPTRKRFRATQTTQFQLSRLDLPFVSSDASPPTISITWAALGDDIPIFTRLIAPSDANISPSLLVISPSPFIPISPDTMQPLLPTQPTRREPLPEDMAPIPREGENLDTLPSAPKTPLYSWNQMSDSLTIAFLLPATTPKEHIRITLAAKSLSLHIIDPPNIELAPDGTVLPKLRIPKFERREWWDGIDPSASFWTWEREGEKIGSGTTKDGGDEQRFIGVLTLYLEKKHEDTRWLHVFSESQPSQAPSHAVPVDGTLEQDNDDNAIPETQDPSELLTAAEALEKYTASLISGDDASGLGLGRGVPSLANKEIDEDVDADVGKRVVCSWLSLEVGRRVDLEDGGLGIGHEWPLDLLSIPLPRSGPPPSQGDTTLVGKHDIDGLLFSLASPPVPSTPSSIPFIPESWTHTSTFPALSFVLASKRDTRFVFHAGSRAVLAFESGESGNVYIYRGASGKPKWNKQAVLRASGHGAGALLGVVALSSSAGGGLDGADKEEIVLLALCEKELVVLRDVI